MTITRSKCVGKQNRSPRSGRSEATVWTVIVSSKVQRRGVYTEW